jgi:hypothetical protein
VGALLGLALGCAGAGPAPSGRPGALVAQATSVTATVEAIDHGQRRVLLRRADGSMVALRLGSEVRNLDQVRKGDRVVATYVDAVAIFVSEDTDEPGATASSRVDVAPLGARPGVVSTHVVELRARVESVDLRRRTLTLMGEQGVIGTFRVDEQAGRLDAIEPGDDVVVRLTEALALSVEPPD